MVGELLGQTNPNRGFSVVLILANIVGNQFCREAVMNQVLFSPQTIGYDVRALSFICGSLLFCEYRVCTEYTVVSSVNIVAEVATTEALETSKSLQQTNNITSLSLFVGNFPLPDV